MKILLNLTGILLVLAIMYLISWKKKNISVRMLVKAVIAQFLIAVILVKVLLDGTWCPGCRTQ